MKSNQFALQIDPALISSLANQYMMTGNGSEKDAAMEAAGQRIVGGQRTRANLKDICQWKSARSVDHLSRNEDTDIDMCLLQAIVSANDAHLAGSAIAPCRLVRVRSPEVDRLEGHAAPGFLWFQLNGIASYNVAVTVSAAGDDSRSAAELLIG